MLHISRWTAAAILLTVFSVSAMAIPSLLPETAFRALPEWAQRRVVPGLEFQGGTRLVVEVDAASIRRERVDVLRDEVRRALRQEKIGLITAPVVRGDSVEVRIREANFDRGLAILRELVSPPIYTSTAAVPGAASAAGVVSITAVAGVTAARPLQEIPAAATVETVGNLVRLTVTEAAVRERIETGREQSLWIIQRRVQEMGAHATIQSAGSNRVAVEVLGVTGRWWDIMH